MTRPDRTPDMSPPETTGTSVRSSCDVVEALFAEFGAVLALPVIAAVVRQAQLDLAATPTTVTGAGLEATARTRLSALAADHTHPV